MQKKTEDKKQKRKSCEKSRKGTRSSAVKGVVGRGIRR